MQQTEAKILNSSSFFCNSSCAYFPCHATTEPDRFNCLFCYCPLYSLGKNCGGSYIYLDNGIKDCSFCDFPHDPENYERILKRLSEENLKNSNQKEGKL